MPVETFPSQPAGPSALQTSTPFTNPDTSALSYIGNTEEREADLPVWETPFPSDPKAYVYHLLYKVKASAFQSMALDEAGPYGGFHIGESNFQTSKGGILSFYREFAMTPDSRSEFESYIYSWQWSTISSEPNSDSITEIPLTVTSRLQFDYFKTDAPETIDLDKAPRAININGTNYYIYGWGSLVLGNEMLAEDAVLRQWKGKIYERMQRFIPVRNLVDEAD